MLRFLIGTLFLTCLVAAMPAFASESEFFSSIEGKWAGPGEIVAGKYKGTKFTCVFDGVDPGAKPGMKIDGYCRVGVFSQPMNALIEKAGGSYSGRFLDGEAGEGMDIIGGRYTRNKLVVDIKRKDLRGVLVASKDNQNHIQMTISVRVDGRLIPVIGMRLDRVSALGQPKVAKRG
ncbi:MAG: hypothetical protein KDJ80_08840 [Nitratireductor sp.]|nr:hypothetical protein [Nitratireductor sp.]